MEDKMYSTAGYAEQIIYFTEMCSSNSEEKTEPAQIKLYGLVPAVKNITKDKANELISMMNNAYDMLKSIVKTELSNRLGKKVEDIFPDAEKSNYD